jgi:glutamate/aspartate transport system substrate-binding protein
MVETDRAAAFVMDDVLLAGFVAGAKSPAAYAISEDAFSKPEPYAAMLRRDDAPFKALVDKATAALYESPEMVTIYNKWFTQPVPPRGLNFNLAVSPELKQAFKQPSDSPDPSHYGS